MIILLKTFPKMRYNNIALINPSFDSPLLDLILKLDHLRKLQISGTTHPMIFIQIKKLFHILESIGSARIEGNNTTVAEYIEARLDGEVDKERESINEIHNMEEAMSYIEEHVREDQITEKFIRELHGLVVKDLTPPPNGEGDKTPGNYRTWNVEIKNAKHTPADSFHVETQMKELTDFICNDDLEKYDLIKVALVHHRFMWIHPFGNGNGRTGRLLTYAMLLSSGFKLDQAARVINPTAIFCSDRDKYNDYLAGADDGSPKGLDDWCFYVLSGLKTEMEKVHQLLNYTFLKDKILKPAINHALKRQIITKKEHAILVVAIEKQVIQNKDLQPVFAGKQTSEITRQLKGLVKKKMLQLEFDSTRRYVIDFSNNYLIRGVINSLRDNDFLPVKD